MRFTSKNPQYEYLRKKWTAHHKALSDNLVDKHLRKVALSGLGGLVLLNTTGIGMAPLVAAQNSGVEITSATSKNKLMAAEILDKLPKEVRKLDKQEEDIIGEILSKNTSLKVLAEIDGKRLNRSYGVIGGEQHLYRYPGDTVYAHARDASDWAMYGGSGIAPGLGAWGYFASSKEAFTKEDEERERYYLAVQTFLSPGFSERVREYRDFYKFRKMLVVNPKTGQAVVAVIGDAGPAEWTGKHLGGSPEVMHELGLAGGPRKGPVLYYFIDDPENKVPLGPIKMEEIK